VVAQADEQVPALVLLERSKTFPEHWLLRQVNL
jgi:hypothetical protein